VAQNQLVEPVFAFFRRKLFEQGQTVGVRDVGSYLAAQGAMAVWFEPRFERLKNLLLGQIRELLAKAFDVAKGVLVDDASEAEEF